MFLNNHAFGINEIDQINVLKRVRLSGYNGPSLSLMRFIDDYYKLLKKRLQPEVWHEMLLSPLHHLSANKKNLELDTFYYKHSKDMPIYLMKEWKKYLNTPKEAEEEKKEETDDAYFDYEKWVSNFFDERIYKMKLKKENK